MATTTTNYNLTKPTMAEIADIRTLNNNMDKVDEVMHSTQVSLAPAYDLTATYNTGDIVMYELLMYKCKEDNVTGAWNPAKWERTTAGENGSGGGSSVVPNPQGSPTDTLETIEIDGTVYDIAGSGGGGSAYEETTLWSGSDSASMTLSESFENYDVVMIIARTTYNNAEYSMSAIWSVDYMKAHINDGMRFGLTGDSWYIYFSITDSTTFVRQDQYYFYISNIIGLKLGGGAGSEIIPISAGDNTTSRTFTFDKTPKFIKFYWGDPIITGGWALDGEIVWGQSYMNFRAKQMGASVGNVDGGIDTITYGVDGKSVTLTGGNAFGAMNTSNGSGYMYVDYGGGSGGSAVKDILYSDANGAPHLTDVALTHNIFDYDEVYFKVSNPTDIQTFNAYTQQVFMPMMYNTGERWGIQALYDQRVVEITFASDGLSFQIVRTAGDYSNNTVYEVIGIKH